MRLLELFSGTGSVGKVARDRGFEVISLDRDMQADIQIDIMDWDFASAFPRHHFDVIWASPPCTEYSRAKTIGARDIEGANKVVERVVQDILPHFEPKYWIIENPQTGMLKDQLCMYGLPYVDVDYCKYGAPYRKRTRLWNNICDFIPRPLCAKDCNSMNEERTKHMAAAQRGSCKTHPDNRFKQDELYRVPRELVYDILRVARH
jgi:site-specific DNA-cytosine methylase